MFADVDVREWNHLLPRVLPVESVTDPTRTVERALLGLLAERAAQERRIPEPIKLRASWLHGEVLADLVAEAAHARTESFAHNGKQNGPPGSRAEGLLDIVDVPQWVYDVAGVRVLPPSVATYIHYSGGDRLELHLDDPRFGVVNLLMCLRHVGKDSRPPSSTVFVLGRNRVAAEAMDAGEVLVFDGRGLPHGRTPLSASEEVNLLLLGMQPR